MGPGATFEGPVPVCWALLLRFSGEIVLLDSGQRASPRAGGDRSPKIIAPVLFFLNKVMPKSHRTLTSG